MITKGAWYPAITPNHGVIENDNGLFMFAITPFRELSADDLQPYKSYHPKSKKSPVIPKYLYRFYGLEAE